MDVQSRRRSGCSQGEGVDAAAGRALVWGGDAVGDGTLDGWRGMIAIGEVGLWVIVILQRGC